MPYCNDDHSLCIWHIPKSGGVFLREALPAAGVPLTRRGGTHDCPDDWPRLREYTYHALLTRDPVEWYQSAWRWMRRAGTKPTNPVARWFSGITPDDLHNFPAFLCRWSGTYRRIVKAFTPSLGCIYLRTETLARDLATWLKSLAVAFDGDVLNSMEPQNVTPKSDPKPTWDTHLAMMVRRAEWN